MLHIRSYGIRAKPSLLSCAEIDHELAELLSEGAWIIRSREGGRSAWFRDDHLAKVKLLFLIQLKTEYDEQFIQEAPLSLEFFDRWWTAETFHEVIDQQDILDNLDPKWSKQLVPTGRPLVDDMIQRIATREPRTKFDVEVPRYRVWWEGDVVGWVDDFVWDFPHLSGKWSPTVNPKGREFASLGEVGIVYPVVLDGASYLHGELVQRPDGVTIKVQLVSAQRQREATEPAPAPERAGGK